jgi:hypothetical protein
LQHGCTWSDLNSEFTDEKSEFQTAQDKTACLAEHLSEFWNSQVLAAAYSSSITTPSFLKQYIA